MSRLPYNVRDRIIIKCTYLLRTYLLRTLNYEFWLHINITQSHRDNKLSL